MDIVLEELPIRERYKFLTAVVTPRPIALVTSRSRTGVVNAAPYSFFNIFSEDPAIIVLGFSSRPDSRTKDTLINIRETEDFVVNMVDCRIVNAMHVASADFPYGESELTYMGVTMTPSRLIETPRIAEAPASLECVLFSSIELSERRTLVLGRVLCLHILDEVVDAGTRRIIPEKYSPLARLYGDYYAWLGLRYTKSIPSNEEVEAGVWRAPLPDD